MLIRPSHVEIIKSEMQKGKILTNSILISSFVPKGIINPGMYFINS